ncbi:hypothetical protein SBBP2_290011 [Burkholderiales bacterium]|nr:hypothetical protein SBBP2_290011 [Burkholderiales bacterium]
MSYPCLSFLTFELWRLGNPKIWSSTTNNLFQFAIVESSLDVFTRMSNGGIDDDLYH